MHPSLHRDRPIIAGLAGLILALGVAGTTFAHADLVNSEPGDGAALERAPEQLRLYFSEPLEPGILTLEISAADRRRMETGPPRLSPTDAQVVEVDLPAAFPTGTYTVAWRILSRDSHTVRGVFAYTVGTGVAPGRPLDLALPSSGPPFAAEAATRWLTFLGLFVLLGGFAFPPLVLQPALRRAGLTDPRLAEPALTRWTWLAWISLGGLLLLSGVGLLLQASSTAGVPLAQVFSGPFVSPLLTATRYGVLWLARVGLLLAAAGVLVWLGASSAPRPRLTWWAGAILTSCALLTLSATGHASAVPRQPTIAVAVDWLHVVAGGVWIGGLVWLTMALPAILRALDADERRRLLGQLVQRFSWLAGASVLAIVLSGAYAGTLYIPSADALLDTTYGAALSGKLILVAPLLLLGAVNLLVLHPRVRRAVAAGHRRSQDPGAARTLRWLVLGEVLLATAVLGVTGVLAGLPPASSVVGGGRPYAEVQRTPAGTPVTLSVRPNLAGENTISVEAAGQAVGVPSDVEGVRLTLLLLDRQVGARQVVVPPTAEPGRFEVSGNHLSMPGRWDVQVTLQRSGRAEETTRFPLVVGEPPGASRPAISPGRIVLKAANGRTLFAALLVAASVLLLAGTRQPKGGWRRATPTVLAQVALLSIGLVVAGSSVAEAYRLSLPNPVLADANSLMRGEAVYFNNGCALCHGVSGRGDGPDGRLLRPPPTDFRADRAAGRTDRELFDRIEQGGVGTGMPAFKDRLTEQEQWDAINFIRTLAGR